jgi:hypothetical protein
MKAAILILAISLPGVVSAQDNVSTSTTAPAMTAAQAPPQGTAKPPVRQRRRGTMVGYIADGIIEDYVRVRLDAGYDNNIPDRAEFFYAQCGCNGGGAPGPGIPGPQDLATSVNFQQLIVDLQYAPHPRVAVFGSIPLRFVQPQSFLGELLSPPQTNNTFESGSGFSDIRAGVKGSIVSTDTATLTAQVQFYFASGDAAKGLGTDHTSFETALLFHQTLSDKVTIESQFGDWHPIGGSSFNGIDYAGDVLFYGIGPSYELVNTGHLTFAPVVELVGWHVLGGLQQPGPPAGQVLPAEGTNIVNLKLGARTTFDDRSSLYVGYGFAMTDAQWYGKIIRFEYRYSF